MNGGLKSTAAEAVMSYFKADYHTGVCLEKVMILIFSL
jgi:hypothetical protein